MFFERRQMIARVRYSIGSVFLISFLTLNTVAAPSPIKVKELKYEKPQATEVYPDDKISWSDSRIVDEKEVSKLFKESAGATVTPEVSRRIVKLLDQNKAYLQNIRYKIQNMSKMNSPTVKGEISTDEGLDKLTRALQLTLLEARHLTKQGHSQELIQYAIGWLNLANYLAVKEESLIGLRVASVIRAIVMDEMENQMNAQMSSEGKINKFAADLSFVELSKISKMGMSWPVDKVIQAMVADVQLKMTKELKDKGEKEVMKSYFGLSGERIDELLDSNKKNFSLDEFINDTNYYMQHLTKSFQKNPYVSQTATMDKVIAERWIRLQGEAGSAGEFLAALGGFGSDAERRFVLSSEGADSLAFRRIKKNYSSTRHPLSRLITVQVLNNINQIYRPQDVQNMKTELSRYGTLRANLAVLKYKQLNKKAPDSLQELVGAGLLESVPVDYFTGKPLKYSQSQAKVLVEGMQ